MPSDDIDRVGPYRCGYPPGVDPTSTQGHPLKTFDLAAAVDELHNRPVNYDEMHAPPHVTTGWHQDRWTVTLGHEAPGEPIPGGLAATAEALVDSYEFTDPHILRATFRHPGDLLDRDMLLEGRFLALRFPIGVRITAKHDELRERPDGPERVIGWSYQTLRGHLEQGRLTYEVAKHLGSGRVEFRIDAHSRRAPIRNPLLALGFQLFGRRMQLRFYRHALERLTRMLDTPPGPVHVGPDGLVRAPSDAGCASRFDPFMIRFAHPGR